MNLRHWISEVPVIIISSENDVDFIRRSYDLGARITSADRSI